MEISKERENYISLYGIPLDFLEKSPNLGEKIFEDESELDDEFYHSGFITTDGKFYSLRIFGSHSALKDYLDLCEISLKGAIKINQIPGYFSAGNFSKEKIIISNKQAVALYNLINFSYFSTIEEEISKGSLYHFGFNCNELPELPGTTITENKKLAEDNLKIFKCALGNKFSLDLARSCIEEYARNLSLRNF
jgi:hypothetical protein